MKRIITLVLCILLLSGCSSRDNKEKTDPGSADPIQSDVADQEAETGIANVVSEQKEEEPDLDLTELSSTMVYSEVFNMLNEPDNYVGKKIKMRGAFGYYIDDEDNYHFGCVIADATACCAQGIEFVLTDELVYPDEYPEIGTEITVIGDFDYYFDGNFINAVLYDAHFE